MNCPKCGGATAVINSRLTDGSPYRRRECVACPTRFSTTEALVEGTVTLRPPSLLGRPRAKLLRPKVNARRCDVKLTEAAAAAGLTRSKYKMLRAEARREAVRTNTPIETVFARFGVLTPREKSLLSNGTRPTVADTP